MEIIPAIDLRGGKCVRLYQGDYSQETVFSDDPVDIALKWQALGAERMHLVDLDGAARGELCNLATIGKITSKINIPCQVGGGIREIKTIEQLLAAGVKRVILGTAAVENPKLIKEACLNFGEAIILGLDARGGYICTRGWLEKTDLKATTLARDMAGLGAKRFIYTDISRDGTLTEPNFEAVAELLREIDFPVIASGGVSSISHLRRLNRLGAEGAIVGRALYTGDMRLEEALAIIKQDTNYGNEEG